MSPIFIILCIVALLIPIGFSIYYKSKAEDQRVDLDILKRRNETLEERFEAEESHPATDATAYKNAYEVLQAMSVKHQFKLDEYKREEDCVSGTFEYQGALLSYCAGLTDQGIALFYYNCVWIDYTQENYTKVQAMCLELNLQYRHVKITYTYEEEENRLYIHQEIACIGLNEEGWKCYTDLFFEMVNGIKNFLFTDHRSPDDFYEAKRQQQMLMDAEMRLEERKYSERHPRAVVPNRVALAAYIQYLFTKEKTADLLSLTVQSATQHYEITERHKIAAFDLLKAAVEVSKKGEVSLRDDLPVVLTLETVVNHYVFTLHPVKVVNNAAYVRLTAVCTPHEYLNNDYIPEATYEPKAISMLLCYADEIAVGTNEESGDLRTHNGQQIHHGHLLLQQKCYLQAIAVLTPMFNKLKMDYFHNTTKDKEQFYQVCYDLGYSYNELRQYDRASYYLRICHQYGRFDYSQEYFNSLAEGRDLRVFSALDKEIQVINKYIQDINKNKDKWTEDMSQHQQQLVDYYAFLHRRRGYSQINFGFLDDAEETFKSLLQHEPSREYAEHELQYIKQLRDGEHNS